MRTFAILALLLAFWPGNRACARQDAEEKGRRPPFSISINGPGDTKSGSEISITILVKNLSDHDIDMSAFSNHGVNLCFQYEVSDQNGRLMEKRNLPWAGSLKTTKLAPGEEIQEHTLISRAVAMTLPRQYTIQVSRSTGYPNDPPVRSNKITLSVVE